VFWWPAVIVVAERCSITDANVVLLIFFALLTRKKIPHAIRLRSTGTFGVKRCSSQDVQESATTYATAEFGSANAVR
jgi:hypothetical protein